MIFDLYLIIDPTKYSGNESLFYTKYLEEFNLSYKSIRLIPSDKITVTEYKSLIPVEYINTIADLNMKNQMKKMNEDYKTNNKELYGMDFDNRLNKLVDFETNNIRVFFVTYDIFQETCRQIQYTNVDISGSFIGLIHTVLKQKLDDMANKNIMIPSVNFMFACATKTYTTYFKQYMIQPTLVYPADIEQINTVKEQKYIIKPGLSSNNMNIVRNVEKSMILDTAKEIMHKFNNNCPDNILLIQPMTDLYDKCFEYRFMVCNDKIIGFAITETRHTMTHNNENFNNKKLSTKVYTFLKTVIKDINKYYPNYFYARIDIILECSIQKDTNVYTYSHPIFDDSFKGTIYLNELEPLGSGLKYNISCAFTDDEQSATVINSFNKDSTNTDYLIQTTDGKQINLNEWIYYCIIKELYSKLNHHTQIGGSYNNYKQKYYKYKAKYMKLMTNYT